MRCVCVLAQPIEAVCKVPNEKACPKRMKMQMLKGLVMVRICDNGSEQEARLVPGDV